MSDCITCENTDCLIKKNIKNPNIEKYLVEKHNIKCKKSQQFIMEGAPAHGLFFVRKGQVKVVKTGIYGREQIVRFAHDGEIIGHRGFGSGKNYPIGALAIKETHLCNFTNEILMKMLHEIPDLTFDLMLFYSEELNRSETKVRKFAQMTVREKVIFKSSSKVLSFRLLNGLRLILPGQYTNPCNSSGIDSVFNSSVKTSYLI